MEVQKRKLKICWSGACRSCRTGQDAQCSSIGGIIGVTVPGGFAEFFKAPARNVLPLPDAVSFESGGLVSCGVITAVHAYRRARLLAHEVAVVIGAGGIGLDRKSTRLNSSH